jgi:HTH-type transcriptional regulator/antitoxin HigA
MPAARKPIRPVTSTYRKLVAKFPLRTIRDDAELAAAQSVLDDLLRRELDEGGEDYLDVLTDLIEKYEREAHPIPDASEADVLRLLMEGRGLSQPKLAKEVGIAQSTLSAVLGGTRGLTKAHVLALARYFGVSPAAFLPRVEPLSTAP